MYNSNMPYLKIGDIILYTVNKGDNVYRIAQMFHTETEMIRCMNKLNEDYLIMPGQQLLIPVIYHHSATPNPGPYRQSYDLYF